MKPPLPKTGWPYLWAVIKYRLSRKRCIGKHAYVLGKKRKIIGETYQYIIVDGVNQPLEKNLYFIFE